MPLQTHQIPSETAAPLSPSSARLGDTSEVVDAAQNEAIAGLLEVAENAEQKRRAVFGIYYPVSNAVALLFVGWLVAMIARILGFHLLGADQNLLYAMATALTLNFLSSGLPTRQWIARYSRAVYDTATGLLPIANEPRRLLPLVDSLRAYKTPDERRQFYPALTELLWNLPANDAALLLDATRRDALRTALIGSYWIMANFKRQASDGHFDNPTADLAVAIMKTLASIGDKKSVKALQKIIGAEAKTPNDTVVRDAAREYLPVLTQKIAEDKAARKKVWACLYEQIRDPQKVLGEYLDTLSPEAAVAVLVNCLQAEKTAKVSWPVWFVTTFIFITLMLFIFSQLPLELIFFLLIILFIGATAFVTMLSHNGVSRETRKIAYNLCYRCGNDVRVLTQLIDYAKWGAAFNGKYENDAATKAIARLLPLLQPGDAALVPPAQRAYLRSWLKLPQRKTKRDSSGGKGNTSQTLAILALNALGTIGDTKALPAAEAIARRTTRGNYHEADLHEAALRCVDALRMRKN